MLAGCVTTVHNEPVNLPLATSAGDIVEQSRELPATGDDLLVGLAFSGGGMRAAAFSYGVLSEFDRIRSVPRRRRPG